MALLGVAWLGYEFWRLLSGGEIWPGSPPGGVDLEIRHAELERWFGDDPISIDRGYYPPATYTMLWPIFGPLELATLRWVWGLLSAGCLIWLARLTVVYSRVSESPESVLQKRFTLLVPISMYAAGASIGNGQHAIHVLPMLIAAIFLALRPGASWGRDTLATVLFLGALIKPQISAPFFWIMVFLPGRLRIATLIVLGYLLLTLVALSFQAVNISDYFRSVNAIGSLSGTGVRFSDMGALLRKANLGSWGVPVLLSGLAGVGLWIWYYRRVDIWLLLGVTAIISRFLMYHRWFDDLILLLPLITLFRLATAEGTLPSGKVVAGILFGMMWLSLLAPGGLYVLPSPLNVVYALGQTAVWLAVLMYLVIVTIRKHSVPARPTVNRSNT
jgi:hypothetical protein